MVINTLYIIGDDIDEDADVSLFKCFSNNQTKAIPNGD